MRFAAGIDVDAELVLRGEAPPGADPELVEVAFLVSELRSAHARPPAEATRERQLAAIVAEVDAMGAGSAVAAGQERAQVATRIPPARHGHPFAFRLAATGLAALVGITGLAIAGVKPLAPIDGVLERVGIATGDDDTAPPAEGRPDPAEAPKQGDAARDRAGDRGDRGAGDTDRGRPGTRGQGGERRSETGTRNSEPGRGTAEEAQGGQTPPPSPGRSGENRPDNAGPPAAPGSQGKGKGKGQSQSEDKSAFGQQQAEEAKGGPGASK